MKSNFLLIAATLAALGKARDLFLSKSSGRMSSGRPNIRHHGHRERHYPHIPNGKWVMKYHRGR